jgi:hypothetical protein
LVGHSKHCARFKGFSLSLGPKRLFDLHKAQLAAIRSLIGNFKDT